MLTITVARDGSGDFATIGEAVQAVYDYPSEAMLRSLSQLTSSM